MRIIKKMPWPHLLEDKFLTKEDWDKVYDIVNEVDNSYPEDKTVKQFHYGNNPTPLYNILLPYAEDLKKNYLHKLNYGKKTYDPNNQFVFEVLRLPPGYTFEYHTDIATKILSGVLYIKPEKGEGTILSRDSSKNTEEFQIEWKQNRLLAFSGQSEARVNTWHRFENNTPNTRCTINLIIADNLFRRDDYVGK